MAYYSIHLNIGSVLLESYDQSTFRDSSDTTMTMSDFISCELASGTLNQAPLPLRRSQEIELLFHIFVTHSLTGRHLGTRKRTEETGGCQPQFQAGKVKSNANYVASVGPMGSTG